MRLVEVLHELNRLKELGFNDLNCAIDTEDGLKLIKNIDVEISSDGVGKFILFKKEQND